VESSPAIVGQGNQTSECFLFDPHDEWMMGLTPVGRATIRVLAMKEDEQRALREELLWVLRFSV